MNLMEKRYIINFLVMIVLPLQLISVVFDGSWPSHLSDVLDLFRISYESLDE